MSNIASRVLTGKKIKNTYQNLLQIYDNNLTDGLGNTVFDTSSCLITASWADSCSFVGSSSYSTHASVADTASFSLISFITQSISTSISSSWASSSLSSSWADFAGSASWAPTTPSNVAVSASWASASLSSSWSDFARSASWAPSSVGGTTLNTGSTYPITSSWSTNSITASFVNSASFASFSNSASYAASSHNADTSSYVLTVNSSSFSTFSNSSSYSSNSHNADSASYVLTVNTSSYSSFARSSSWAPNLYPQVEQTSASWASASLSSSWADFARSASWSPTVAGGTTLNTGSTYQITSSWAVTASYAINTNTLLLAATTQSSFDMPIRDMSFENSAGLSQVQTTAFTQDIDQTTFMPYYYVKFLARDFGAVHDLGYCVHQMKVPKTFGRGLTHSFQFINVGDDGSTGIGTVANTAYWQIHMYAITASITPAANMNAAVLVETKILTQSLSGGSVGLSKSVWSTSSYFNDPNGYITTHSVIILNVVRVSTTETSTIGGNGTDYTASLGMISSRYDWGA